MKWYSRAKLGAMTATQLRQVASQFNINGRSSMRKDALVDAIWDAQPRYKRALLSTFAFARRMPSMIRSGVSRLVSGTTQRPRLALSLAVVLAVAPVGWGVVYAFNALGDKPATETAEAQPRPFASMERTIAPAPVVNRDPRFIQQDVGYGELYRVIGEGLEGNNADEYTEDLLENAGHDARALAVYANGAGLWPDPNKVEPLLTQDKTYLSEEGIGLWYSLRGALTAESTTAEVGDAPSNGTNSGVSGGTYGQASRAGISGNRKAVVYTFRDGSKMYVMIRCGNLVYLIVTDLPVVETDECYVPANPIERHREGPATKKQPLLPWLALPTPAFPQIEDKPEETYDPDKTGPMDDPDSSGDAPADDPSKESDPENISPDPEEPINEGPWTPPSTAPSSSAGG
jgi:hypothetical protein